MTASLNHSGSSSFWWSTANSGTTVMASRQAAKQQCRIIRRVVAQARTAPFEPAMLAGYQVFDGDYRLSADLRVAKMQPELAGPSCYCNHASNAVPAVCG